MIAVQLAYRPHVVYRIFGFAGELLYVGISANPFGRLDSHRTKKVWWDQIAFVEFEHFPNRDAALNAEYHAIVAEKPIHNLQARPPKPPVEPGVPEEHGRPKPWWWPDGVRQGKDRRPASPLRKKRKKRKKKPEPARVGAPTVGCLKCTVAKRANGPSTAPCEPCKSRILGA